MLKNSRRREILKSAVAIAGAASIPHALQAAGSDSKGIDAPRVGLVIGNGRYMDSPLANPVNDANAIAQSLSVLGFKTQLLLNATLKELSESVGDYVEQLRRQKAVGLFYYAGHGVQLGWRNYIIPIGSKINRLDDVPKQAYELNVMLSALAKAQNPMNIIILDACRDNPFGKRVVPEQKGLSQFDAPIGSLLSYATSPGNTASDGSGENGLFTENFLREMKVPLARIEDVFKRVRLNVRIKSNGAQIPWESTSLEDDFYFIADEAQFRQAEREVIRGREKAEAQANAQAQAEAQAKAQAKAKAEGVARTKADAEERARAKALSDEEEKLRIQFKADSDATLRAKALADAKAKAQEEEQDVARLQAQVLAKARAEDEAQALVNAKALAQADARAKVQAQTEAEERVRAENEVRSQISLQKQSLELRLQMELSLWEKAQASATAGITEDYLKQYPSGFYSELAVARLDVLLAKAGEKKLNIQATVNNPFTKGSASGILKYAVGDQFTFVSTDPMTGIEESTFTEVVTRVSDTQIEFGGGRKIVDLLGNELKSKNVRFLTPAQFYPNNYTVGHRWSTSYGWLKNDGRTRSMNHVDFKIVAREPLTTAAGKFNAFKIVGVGRVDEGGTSQITYWIDPEKCSCPIVFEVYGRSKKNNNMNTARRKELIAFQQRTLG